MAVERVDDWLGPILLSIPHSRRVFSDARDGVDHASIRGVKGLLQARTQRI